MSYLLIIYWFISYKTTFIKQNSFQREEQYTQYQVKYFKSLYCGQTNTMWYGFSTTSIVQLLQRRIARSGLILLFSVSTDKTRALNEHGIIIILVKNTNTSFDSKLPLYNLQNSCLTVL